MIVEKFGLRGKHIAAEDEHVSDLSVRAAEALLEEAGIDPRRDRRRHVLRLDVEGLRGVAGGAVDRAPDRRDQRLRGRVRQRLLRDAGRAADRARHAARRGRAAHDPRRRGVPRVVPARLRERALSLHVQLRRRRGRRAARQGRRAQRAARLPRDHRRLVLAAGEGSVGRQRLAERRLPLPRRRRSGGDEGRPRRGQPRELRRAPRAAPSSGAARRSRTSVTSAAST